MKTEAQIIGMQAALRLAMMSMQSSGAPMQVVQQSGVALASAEDTLNWVMDRPSTIGDIETEYNRQRNELSKQ